MTRGLWVELSLGSMEELFLAPEDKLAELVLVEPAGELFLEVAEPVLVKSEPAEQLLLEIAEALS